MGSFSGVQKVAAKRIGIPFDDYIERMANEKWCTVCKSWKLRNSFCIDNSRGDGLGSKCVDCRCVKERKSIKGRVSTFKGKSHSERAKKTLSEKRIFSIQNGQILPPMTGKKHTLDARKKMSQSMRANSKKGADSHSYKDGKLVERRGIRFSSKYKQWRFDVYLRDNFTCQKCGDNKGGNLNAHHIKPFADYPELRFEVSNGLTLCENCHKEAHKK